MKKAVEEKMSKECVEVNIDDSFGDTIIMSGSTCDEPFDCLMVRCPDPGVFDLNLKIWPCSRFETEGLLSLNKNEIFRWITYTHVIANITHKSNVSIVSLQRARSVKGV